MTRFTIAAAQYPIEQLESWADYADKLTAWVEAAVTGGAALAVFPEYGAMELAALDPATSGDLAGSLASVAAFAPQVDALHGQLAARLGIHILAASMQLARSGRLHAGTEFGWGPVNCQNQQPEVISPESST